MHRTVLTTIVALTVSSAASAQAVRIHLNEYNAVGSTKWLNNPDAATPTCPMPATATRSRVWSSCRPG